MGSKTERREKIIKGAGKKEGIEVKKIKVVKKQKDEEMINHSVNGIG